MTPAEEAAARQEAEMLKHLGIDETATRTKAAADAAAAAGDRRKFIRGFEKQRMDLKRSGMDEWEIDCIIAEQIGEPPPPMPPGRTNAPLVEVGSMADGTAAQVPIDALPAGAVPVSGDGVPVTARVAAAVLQAGPAVPLIAVEPVEMTDEEMQAAITRVRTAKTDVAAAETLLAEVQEGLAAARMELAEAQRLVAAGAAWLTQ